MSAPVLMDKKGRKAPPSHYSVKIKFFSLLSKVSFEKYESEEFEEGGYKWRLHIYPTGNKKVDGQGHVSIYLMLSDRSSLPVGWEVNAIVNFSAYNFLENEYVTTQDASIRRFNVLKSEWGISKFIDLETFNDPSKGYLFDDTCVFGAEVFVFNTTIKGDCLSMIQKPVSVFHSWKFDKYSSASLNKYKSQPFVAGNYKWNLLLYPKGDDKGRGNSISLFLALDASTLPTNTKLCVNFILRVKDQISEHHVEYSYCRAFSHIEWNCGYPQFVSLTKFKDSNSGFLVKDSCIFEAEVTVLGLITHLTE
ncbi:hypothetical protein RIF29_24999 [Crotalaria pallida]|uniref:MATH domain-containing protein n=1 Tax=Crotalaria pallida TaxID=3830 RepID=A0AAN9ELC1_CROPI